MVLVVAAVAAAAVAVAAAAVAVVVLLVLAKGSSKERVHRRRSFSDVAFHEISNRTHQTHPNPVYFNGPSKPILDRCAQAV